MVKKLFPLMAAVLLTSSCSLYRVESFQSASEFYPSKESTSEVAYLAAIEETHKVIGDILVNAERRQRLNDVIEKMKREAAIMGGDAITDIRTDASGAWKKLPAQELLGNAFVRANYTAAVVVFNETGKTRETQTLPEN